MNVLFLRGCKAHFLTMVVDGEGTKQGRGGWRARMGSSRAQRARAPVTQAEDADCVPMSPLTPPTPALGF